MPIEYKQQITVEKAIENEFDEGPKCEYRSLQSIIPSLKLSPSQRICPLENTPCILGDEYIGVCKCLK